MSALALGLTLWPAEGPRRQALQGAPPSTPTSRPSPPASSPSGSSTSPRSAATVPASPTGIDIQIVNKIAKDECLEPAYQQATYADAVQSISGGNIDLAVGTIDATEKRLKAVDFSASTYLDGMGLASKTGATTVADLEKMNKVGTIDGYLWVEDLKRRSLATSLVTYPSSVELKADFDAVRFRRGRRRLRRAGAPVQACLRGVTVALSQTKSRTPRVGPIKNAPEAAFPMTKGNTSLQGGARRRNYRPARQTEQSRSS